jgi:hypothetical protein
MWENTVVIHSILKEKNYKTEFLTSSILKKIKSIKIILKKINKKKRKSWKKKSNFEKKNKKRGERWKKSKKKKNYELHGVLDE